MVDEFDLASDIEQMYRDAAIKASRQQIAAGEAGVCELCEEDSKRLIISGGYAACARCRDRYKLP